MPVLSGASGVEIASGLAAILDMEYVALESRRFPDGEAYVRIPPESIESVRSESVVLVSNTFPDSGIMQTLFLLGAVRDVRKGDLSSLKGEWEGETHDVGPGIFLAIPYYGYARQDKRFGFGESVSAKLVADLLSELCDGIVILDLHAPEVLRDMGADIEFVSSMPEIADSLRRDVSPDFILSPDKGAISRATEVAELILSLIHI